MYDNNVRKRSKQDEAPQTVAKSGLTPRKMMLCVWWNWKRIHYELLPPSQTILIAIVNHWKDYAKQSRESDQN